MTPAERDLAATAARLLAEGQRIDRLSRPLTLIAMAALLLAALPPLAAPPRLTALLSMVVLLGLAQSYHALRVSFDAGLFAALRDGTAPPDLGRLDAALIGLGLLAEAKAGRPLAPRIAGATRLLRRQAALLLAQFITGLAAALL